MTIDVRVKIAALWTATLFLFAYGDILGFFRKDVIHDVMAGRISGFDISQGFLLFTSIYVAIPSVMVFLSLVLKSSVNRWTNIVLGILYAASIVGFSIGETWLYYIFLSIVEGVLLLAIVWYAWRWPRSTA